MVLFFFSIFSIAKTRTIALFIIQLNAITGSHKITFASADCFMYQHKTHKGRQIHKWTNSIFIYPRKIQSIWFGRSEKPLSIIKYEYDTLKRSRSFSSFFFGSHIFFYKYDRDLSFITIIVMNIHTKKKTLLIDTRWTPLGE